MELTVDDALLMLNDWLGERVSVVFVVQSRPSGDLPPRRGIGDGWHVVLAQEVRLARADSDSDLERQINIGTYVLGDAKAKLLLGGLPCEHVVAMAAEDGRPHRLAFYLPGSTTVLLVELLAES